MNNPYGSTVNAKGKKQIRSSAALALAVGLVWAFSGSVALAGESIPGIDFIPQGNPVVHSRALAGEPIVKIPIGLEGDPDSRVKFSTTTDEHGAFHFDKLPAGNYKLTLPGLSPQSVTVGEKGTIRGVLSREPDGKASITFNGQGGVVPDLPSAPVNTSRSNKKAGIAKGEEPPPDDVLPSAPVNTSRSNKKAGKVAENNSPLPTNRGIIVGAGPGGGPHASPDDGDVKPGISEANSALGAVSTTRGTAPPPGDYDGDGKPGIAGDPVITVTPVNDPPSKVGDPIPGVGLEGDDDVRTAPGGGGNKELPGTVKPISGVPIGLEGDPGSIKVSAKTDVNGAYQFTGLPAGKYKLILPDKSVKSITIDAGGTTRGKVMRSGDGVIVTGDFPGSPAKVIGAIAIGTKSPAGAAPGETLKIFDRWGTTGGISGGFGGGPSIPGGIGGAGAPGAGMRP